MVFGEGTVDVRILTSSDLGHSATVMYFVLDNGIFGIWKWISCSREYSCSADLSSAMQFIVLPLCNDISFIAFVE